MKKAKLFATLLGAFVCFSQFEAQAQSGCCCESCVCPPGPQGPQGAQGIPGSQGGMGIQGVQGLVGLDGTQGPQGIQGLVGPQGPCCPSNSVVSVANVYSLTTQNILPGDPVLLENANVVTLGDYDISLAPTTGEIVFLKSGVYHIEWTVEGQLSPPFPNPVPAWGYSLFLDGLPVSGSCFSGFTLFPAEETANTGGAVYIVATAGQVLTLQSVSTLPTDIVAAVLGLIIPEVSASILIQKL